MSHYVFQSLNVPAAFFVNGENYLEDHRYTEPAKAVMFMNKNSRLFLMGDNSKDHMRYSQREKDKYQAGPAYRDDVDKDVR